MRGHLFRQDNSAQLTDRTCGFNMDETDDGSSFG